MPKTATNIKTRIFKTQTRLLTLDDSLTPINKIT